MEIFSTAERLNASLSDALASSIFSSMPDTVKVFNLLKALANLVNAKAGGEPYLIGRRPPPSHHKARR